jgi:D-alanyl-D-alanine carboxypeptidase
MPLPRAVPSRWIRVVGLLAALAVAGGSWDQAEARSARSQAKPRAIHGPSYRPPYADIVIDDKTGEVLHAVDADAPRRPASLTKIMTLYLLFEQLENGKLTLDTPLPVSAWAAVQNPTKLGLRANQTIKVEDAIKGLVTKSANDAAVVVAEAIGGSETEFAQLMTAKARMLGMTSTTYVNASGLPADDQLTTARDQAVLGRAIQHRFPVYYQYFSTPSFNYRGVEMRNHNHLLEQVRGVDGIKTGYTELSGYNLVTSVRRDEKHIVAVVLGGTSNAARDARMRQLIEEHIALASSQRTVRFVVDGVDNLQDPPAPVFPAIAKTDKPAGRDGAPVRAKAGLMLFAKPQDKTAKGGADTATRAASGKAAPLRAQRATPNAPTLSSVDSAPASVARQPRHAERKPGALTIP